MKQFIFLCATVLLIFSTCTNADNTKSEQIQQNDEETITWKSLDTMTSASNDFYQFACGGWLADNPVPEEESKWSNFNVLENSNNTILKNLLEDAEKNSGSKGSAKQLIGDLYHSFSDTNARNSNGIQSIRNILDSISHISNLEELHVEIANLHQLGIHSGFGLSVRQDAKSNDNYAVYLSQGGLGLPNRNYYFDEDNRSKKIRSAYQGYIDDVFTLSYPVNQEAQYIVPMEIETFLAQKSWTPTEQRNVEAKYNKMSIGDLQELAPNFNWYNYLTDRCITVDSVIVQQTDFFTHFSNALEKFSIENWKVYLEWKVLNQASNYLTMDLERAKFDFYSRTMRGAKTMKPLWKRGVMMVSGSFVGQALGQVFVEENFSEAAKVKINEMVDNITLVFKERINNLDWMSNETKKKAQEKLVAFARKLGFPDEWKDYSGLEIANDDLAQNWLKLNQFSINYNLEKLGAPINKNEWGMVPHMVNAYYNPLLNEIVFPAGIMQKPFFGEQFEDAINYARMGAVIGHELTHGFDDNGSKYDAKGNMVNWWTEEDKQKFEAKTQQLMDQYNEYEVLEGIFINGKLTLGENIADLGGLTIAYHAYMRSLEGKEKEVINGYTPEQRFFIAFAQVWQNNIREDELIQRISNDPHSPGKYRVNGVVANMPEFFEAFAIQPGEPMRQPEEQIAEIW